MREEGSLTSNSSWDIHLDLHTFQDLKLLHQAINVEQTDSHYIPGIWPKSLLVKEMGPEIKKLQLNWHLQIFLFKHYDYDET